MKSFISSLLSFLALMLFANGTDNDSIDQHFNEKNKKTAWAQLKEVIAYIDAQPFVAEPEIRDIESLAVYIKTHEAAIEKLYAAARMPCVDFSCYTNTTAPRIIDFTTKIRDCIWLLMSNYQYGVRAGKPDVVYNSLLVALQIDSLLNGNPYIYYQLLKAAYIGIIFQSIQDYSAEASFNKLSVQEIDNLINLIQKKKVEIKTGWEHALLFESSINDEILLKSLPFNKSSDKELALRVANYKSFLKSVAKFITTKQDKTCLYEFKKKEEKINKYFSRPLLGFEDWNRVYVYSESQLDAIEILLQAVQFYKKNGKYPTKTDVFLKENVNAIEYIPNEKGFDLIIKDVGTLSYGYKPKKSSDDGTSFDGTSLRNLFP